MPTVEDIIKKMKSAPNSIRFSELQKVLENKGFYIVRQKGSHAQFRNSDGCVITIKKGSFVKAVYVKDVLKRVGCSNEGKN